MKNNIEVTDLIARGEASDILAVSRHGRPYALKVLHPHLAGDPIIRARFLREAQVLSSIEHEGVVRVYELTEHEGLPAMLLELAENGSLEGRRLTSDDAVAILRRLLEALVHLHARGVIHRDIRPSHVLFGGDGSAKLADFGMASIRDLSGLTRSTVFTSRPSYADPFSWGRGRPTPSEDLYGLGAVTFESLTGSPPPVALFSRDEKQRSRVLAEFRNGTDHRIATIVCGLLDVPARRPRSAAEALDWIDTGEICGGRNLGECLFCESPMPKESSLCLVCGREAPVIKRDTRGHFIALRKMPEDQEVLSPFLRKLRLLSESDAPLPQLITGDVRLYSRAEQKSGVRLPVRIAENVAAESVEPLIELLQGNHPDRIRISRHPMTAGGRVKRGPLIRIREGTVVPEASLVALRRLRDQAHAETSPTRNQAGEDLRRECAYALAVAVRRLSSSPHDASGLGAETIEALSSGLFNAVAHLETTNRYLATVDLQAAYAELERSGLDAEPDAETNKRVCRLFDAYSRAEERAARIRNIIAEACRVLERVTATSLVGDLEQVRTLLGSQGP